MRYIKFEVLAPVEDEDWHDTAEQFCDYVRNAPGGNDFVISGELTTEDELMSEDQTTT